jgi:hypothetical protein
VPNGFAGASLARDLLFRSFSLAVISSVAEKSTFRSLSFWLLFLLPTALNDPSHCPFPPKRSCVLTPCTTKTALPFSALHLTPCQKGNVSRLVRDLWHPPSRVANSGKPRSARRFSWPCMRRPKSTIARPHSGQQPESRLGPSAEL